MEATNDPAPEASAGNEVSDGGVRSSPAEMLAFEIERATAISRRLAWLAAERTGDPTPLLADWAAEMREDDQRDKSH